MEKIQQVERIILRSRRLPVLVIGLALAVLAGVVTLAALQARQRIREQIAGRDAEVLHAVALWQYAEDVNDGLAEPVLSAGDQLNVALKSSELRGVLGVRLFDPDGEFIDSFPLYVTEQDLPRSHLPGLKALRPVSRFHPRAAMAALFYPDDTAPTGKIPLLEVCVPLHTENGPLAGIAQFLVEGHSIQAEYANLDRLLATRGFLAFGAGGTLLAATLAWAFRRLRRAQQLLTERTENLARANQELALAAKTSALGAVAAHLIHGLKNPLAGLQNFLLALSPLPSSPLSQSNFPGEGGGGRGRHNSVASRGAAPETDEAADWQQAVASTRRMQTMIRQVIGVLREEQAGVAYEVTLKELEEIVRNRTQPLARELGVNFASVIQTEAALPNRAANLVALILINLAENAVQATPNGKEVRLTMNRAGPWLVFEVRDEGSGFPADTPLFMPCRSTKEGGTGIGLALCKQLANHLGAELELGASTSAGCVFTLRLPKESRPEPPDKVRLPSKDPVAD